MECLPTPDCKYFEQGCRDSVHHLYFPKKNYRDKVSREFRNLPENKERLCRAEHDELHAIEPAPSKPSRDEMLVTISRSAING